VTENFPTTSLSSAHTHTHTHTRAQSLAMSAGGARGAGTQKHLTSCHLN